jgi:hypothetical protein
MAVKTKQEAAWVLGGVSGDQRFFASDGCIYSNLGDMLSCLGHMTEGMFNYHVTKEKNDFAAWVQDILHDDKLASDLRKAPTAAASSKLVRGRMDWLKKKAH